MELNLKTKTQSCIIELFIQIVFCNKNVIITVRQFFLLLYYFLYIVCMTIDCRYLLLKIRISSNKLFVLIILLKVLFSKAFSLVSNKRFLALLSIVIKN